MQTSSIFVYAIGFLAQGFFSARMIVQWIMSERSHKVVSPLTYWVCSLFGSILLYVYGYMRNDFAIIFGQLISYYIYIWNLDIKGLWHKLPLLLRILLVSLPMGAIATMFNNSSTFVVAFFRNSHVPLWLLVYGSAGQAIFTIRFIYQWYYSYRRGMSILPIGFWIISLVGCTIIVSYGVFRLDPVLILGQSVGFITYSRNIMIYKKQKK
jgi:lipid-A-disaccharide synthase-like uncharacterized protein